MGNDNEGKCVQGAGCRESQLILNDEIAGGDTPWSSISWTRRLTSHTLYRYFPLFIQVRQVDPTVTFSPVFRHSIRDSVSSGSSTSKRDSTASGTLTEFVAPIIRDADGGEVEEEEEEEVFDDRQLPGVARGRGGEEERESSLALLITSNDRLEVTLSPGALETMLKLLEVSTGHAQ